MNVCNVRTNFQSHLGAPRIRLNIDPIHFLIASRHMMQSEFASIMEILRWSDCEYKGRERKQTIVHHGILSGDLVIFWCDGL